MNKEGFEMYVSLRSDRNGTEAFLSAKKTIEFNNSAFITAICSTRPALDVNKAVGYIVTHNGIKLLFE